ncbi:SAF domain-containing protein [Candidatus Poriferisocius sp.]|uniref:SAF domain-containing protein n=1 Tax=Candidatus Poriferisocius sp. TaxID=3101276 RepID=UPI003B0147B0
MPVSTRRILLIILGVFVLAASVAGFYFVSDAFDKRTPVLVAAVDIQKGDPISADLLTSDLAVMGSIPHIPYTPDAQLAFDGFTASQSIPAGTVILGDMFIPPTLPGPGDLELTVLFDTSLLTSPAFNGDTVLIVAPGVESTAEDPGRPHEAIDTLVLSNYHDGSITMFFSPEELGERSAWKLLPEAIGAAPQIMLVPLGADPEEFAQLINAAWQSEWETRAAAAALLAAQSQPEPAEEVAADSDSGALESPRESAAARGELELTVQFDTSLLTSPADNGDTVLVVDPGGSTAGGTAPILGLESAASGPGQRPQKAITHMELSNYEAGTMTMFFKPQKEELEEMSAWRQLPEVIGAAPQIMLVPSGSDPEEFAQLLNGVWRSEWEARVARAAAALLSTEPEPGSGELALSAELEVTVPLDTSLTATEVSEGDTVLMVDPGQPPEGDDVGRPRRVLQTIELENFDGAATRLLVPLDEWLEWFYWVRLPDELGAAPIVLPIPEGADVDAEIERLNGRWHDQWRSAVGELSASEGAE